MVGTAALSGGGLQSSWAIMEEIRTGKKIQKAPPSELPRSGSHGESSE